MQIGNEASCACVVEYNLGHAQWEVKGMLGERPVWPGKAVSCGSSDGKENPRLAVAP